MVFRGVADQWPLGLDVGLDPPPGAMVLKFENLSTFGQDAEFPFFYSSLLPAPFHLFPIYQAASWKPLNC